jgi:hypothetical protein
MAFLVAAILIAVGGRAWMGPSQSIEGTALSAARLQLLALEASLPLEDRVNRGKVAIRPGHTVVPEEVAVQALARLPKPARCSATVVEGALTIECEAVVSDELARVHARRVQDLDGGVDGRPFVRAGPILVEGGRKSLNVELEVFKRWYRDYHLPSAISLSMFDPTEDQAAAGVKARVQLSRTEEVAPDSLPRELKSQFDALRRDRRLGSS